jgi:molybdopterin-guanine dinucleotide biosynthesis protein A
MSARKPVPPFGGAVLCGGASRRMGRDKALIVVEGRALAVRVVEAIAAAGATSVVAVGGDVGALRDAGLAAVPDAEPGAGPLTGIVTALGAVPDDIVFVAACDLVAPSAAAVAAAVQALAADALADVAAPVVAGRRQWMHAAWRRRSEVPLGAAFAAGERAVHAAVSAGGLRVVDVAVDPRSVADADTPSDLPVAGPQTSGVPGGGAVRPNR